ncbi:hypothetical protein EJB05_39028 [Eragrostis curvula]|uniref:F-box domain-containing protein n=1 Tax=Eragrostis curvula TaxID=38414 RepID=A0A5J9TVY6_9POAL|nr:hypothetical protein EJB05_39028 [Eragrostis curvula]
MDTMELFCHEATEIEAAVTKDLEPEDQEDRLSNLPDDILTFILERLKLHEAARTSVLSRRWRHLFGFRSSIQIHIVDYAAQSNASVVEATKSMLADTIQSPISILSVKFLVLEESIDIIRCVDNAMANRQISALQFLMHGENFGVGCDEDSMVAYGRRFMRFFDAGPRAFAGLTCLYINCLKLGTDDLTHVLNACTKLERLSLDFCNWGIPSELQIRHPKLTRLKIINCIVERVELTYLPSLTRLFCEQSWISLPDLNPLSFGYVPQLSELILSNQDTEINKTFQLSEFLSNTMLRVLDLDFECGRIWIKPEASNLVRPRFENLKILCLRRIHEECDLDWIMFLMEAAPVLQRMYMQVSDYTVCKCDKSGHTDQCQVHHQEGPADWKHYNLVDISIRGYQVNEKFTRFIKLVVEAAVNLQLLLLLDNVPCKRCQFGPSKGFPRTVPEYEMIKKQVSQWRSPPSKIGFGV